MKQRYDSYKPSGIEWIGEIPEHWIIKPLKYVVSYNDEVWQENTKDEFCIKYVEIGDVSQASGINNYTEYEFRNAPSRARRIVRKDDVIVSTVRTYLKAIAKVREDNLTVSTGFMVLRAKEINPSYLGYIALGDHFIQEIISKSVGVSYPAINSTEIANIKVLIPPLSEQQAIADYLDKKCGAIDAAIAKVDREIELIDELKQSEISRVVTRGLNPNAPLRPSGIDWIGEIPEAWTTMKLKHTVNNVETDFMDGDWIESNDISTDGIRYLTSGNVGPAFYKEQGEGFITEETFTKLNCIEVFPGDLLISRLNEPIARTCFVPDLGHRIVTCVDNVIYRPKTDKFDKRFMMYQLNCKPFWFNASQLSSGATMQRISRSKLGSISVLVPPLSEQREIADYLDKKCAEIDGLKSKLKRKRDTLAELRQSMISEVVTGKRKVV